MTPQTNQRSSEIGSMGCLSNPDLSADCPKAVRSVACGLKPQRSFGPLGPPGALRALCARRARRRGRSRGPKGASGLGGPSWSGRALGPEKARQGSRGPVRAQRLSGLGGRDGSRGSVPGKNQADFMSQVCCRKSQLKIHGFWKSLRPIPENLLRSMKTEVEATQGGGNDDSITRPGEEPVCACAHDFMHYSTMNEIYRESIQAGHTCA